MRNYCPIEGKDAQSQASVRSKQGINNSIIGSDPAYPVEHAQCPEKVSRNPIPNKTSGSNNPKDALAHHEALLVLAVVFVDGIEEGTVSQNTWPDHIRWPDDKLTKESCEKEAKALRTNGEEDLEADGDGLAIEDTLREDNMGWIDPAASRINHECNAHVLLYRKGALVEGPDITKSIEVFRGEDSCKSPTKRETKKLGNDTGK